MAERFDVASRLGEGTPAVENLQHYVWACHQLGYQHPELTLHAAQVRGRYGSEDGMDLFALQADWLALENAVRASQDALEAQDRQASALSAAWQGAGAEASRDFLRRHDEASRAAAELVGTAMEALGALRQSLWLVVDAKVDAVVAIEGRAQAQRADWLAAAATVTTGVGDRTAAAELVDQAVKPFVESSVGRDWLTAMRTATTSAADAYRRAIAEIGAEGRPVFDMPGEVEPTWGQARAEARVGLEEDVSAAPSAGLVAPATTPASAWSPPGATVVVPPPMPPVAAESLAPVEVPAEPPVRPATAESLAPVEVPAEPPVPPAGAESLAPVEVPAEPALPAVSPLPSLGSAMPGFGGGLSGFRRQFADMLGGLLGGTGGFVPETADIGFPELDGPADREDARADDADNADE
ncbi:MAG: hypothetical protein K0U78_11420, partial [Actinomycetia bacterium]|nr:hypothetical protein [Actinomycetes bacterium]